MKLLFLCKRRPMSRDLIENPYGRFYYLPKILARRGHSVTVALLDYENGRAVCEDIDGMRWTSNGVGSFLQNVSELARESKPDWIVGFSDTYFGILASWFARRYSLRCCIDAYDNYESYLGWAKPLHWIWRRALQRADLISGAGPGLVDLMLAGRPADDGVVVPMAADPTGFEPKDQSACRQNLGLPLHVPLVGYCGSMHKSRGVEVLFNAIPLVLAQRPDVRFVHSGRTWRNVPLPDAIHSLGYIDDEQVPVMLNSMNVLVVINRSSAFGEHSYPVKLYEAMSCSVPVVATRTRATEWILRDRPGSLVSPDDPDALARAILATLEKPDSARDDVAGWESSCDSLESALEKKRSLPRRT